MIFRPETKLYFNEVIREGGQDVMYINYLESNHSGEQFAYDVAHEEDYNSEHAFEAITPIPGDKKHIYFGTAPFTPTSFMIEEDKDLLLKDHLMKGYGYNSYLLRTTESSVYDMETGEETIADLMEAIQLWKSGEGCT